MGLNLVYLCEHHGLSEVARYGESVVTMNQYQKERFVQRMIRAMFNPLAGKRIAIFGFAFKANTGDTRESPAIQVCRELLEEHAQVCVTDPQALAGARLDLADVADRVAFEPDPYGAARGAHAIAILTDWSEYRTLDYTRIHGRPFHGGILFDGRTLLDADELHRIGFNVPPIGRPDRTRLWSDMQKTRKRQP